MKRIICAILLIAVLSATLLTGCNDLLDLVNGSDNNSGGTGGVVGGINFATAHKVTFQTNGGTEIEAKNVSKLETAPLTTKEGHRFDGWFLDSTLTQAAIFPLTIEGNMTLYARWVKTEHKFTCNDCKIKYMDDYYNSSVSYNITPYGFDYDRLKELGASGLNLTVTYTVYYKKDYSFNIGYAGAPRYETSVYNLDLLGDYKEDLTTSTKKDSRTITFATTFDYFEDDKITLTFSTNNIQNIIYIQDINVSYEWCNIIN